MYLIVSDLPSDEDLAKIKRESVRGVENDEEVEDMEIPEDSEGEDNDDEGPSEPRGPRRQRVVDEDGWTTIVKR